MQHKRPRGSAVTAGRSAFQSRELFLSGFDDNLMLLAEAA